MTNEQALFPKRNLTDEVPYFPLLFTHCSNCGKGSLSKFLRSFQIKRRILTGHVMIVCQKTLPFEMIWMNHI